MFSASAHKFNGPRGVGFLYVRKGININPLIVGGMQESNLLAGTENVAAIVAMAVALQKNCKEMAKIRERLFGIEKIFLDTLNEKKLDYIRNGSANRIPGNISLSIRDMNGEMLMHRLDLKGICVSTGAACDSVNTQRSHVLKAILIPENYANGTIRISFGKYNTENEAITVAKEILAIAGKV